MFLFLSLALVKRLSEIKNAAEEGNQDDLAGRGYLMSDESILTQLGIGSGIGSILVLAFYANSEEVQTTYSNPEFLWFLGPCMLYWVGRIWILSDRGLISEDPVIFAVKDVNTWIVGLCIGMTILFAL